MSRMSVKISFSWKRFLFAFLFHWNIWQLIQKSSTFHCVAPFILVVYYLFVHDCMENIHFNAVNIHLHPCEAQTITSRVVKGETEDGER